MSITGMKDTQTLSPKAWTRTFKNINDAQTIHKDCWILSLSLSYFGTVHIAACNFSSRNKMCLLSCFNNKHMSIILFCCKKKAICMTSPNCNRILLLQLFIVLWNLFWGRSPHDLTDIEHNYLNQSKEYLDTLAVVFEWGNTVYTCPLQDDQSQVHGVDGPYDLTYLSVCILIK